MSPQPSAASIVARDKRRRRNRRRRGVFVLGLALSLLAFGFLFLPGIVRTQAVTRLSAALHRPVSIEKIRINPLAFSITVEGLEVKDLDGGPFTRWQRLYVDFDSLSFFTSEWRFQEIALDGFAQRVAIARDGALNLADLLRSPADKSGATAAASSSPSRPIRIASLSINSAALTFADASRAQPFSTEVGPLTFTLKNFFTAGDPRAPYEFSALTESGETLAWRGTLSANPLRSGGEFTLGQVALKKYAPYYAPLVNATLLEGVLDVTANYAVDLSERSRELTFTKGVVKLTQLKVAARGSVTPLIDLPSLTLSGVSADGLKLTANVERMAIEGGKLSVVREKDGSLNLSKLLAATPPTVASVNLPTAPTAPSPAASAALPEVKLAVFSVAGLAVDFQDLATPTPVRNSLKQVDFTVQNFSLTEPAAPLALKLFARGSTGGAITLEGSLVRAPLRADLAVKIVSFPLAGATPYLEPRLNLRIDGGLVSVDGKAGFDGSVARFTGEVVVDGFSAVDGVKAEEFAAFTQLALRGIDAVSQPPAVRVGEVFFTNPSAQVTLNVDRPTNLDSILRKEAAPAAPAPADIQVSFPPVLPAGEATPLVWSLGKFTLSNGAVAIVDRSVKPAVRISLDNFFGTITGLSSADRQRADLDIRGKVNGAGSVALTGKLDAKSATRAPGGLTELTVAVKDVDLSPVATYIGTYAGFELARGGLALDIKTRLAQRQIDSTNVITLNSFDLGAPTQSPEATSLPVRLGVTLLKDTGGNIVIDVPVKGDLDDPNFKIGRVVLRVIVNLLTKAATSPFSLIGSVFGGDGEDLAYQEFAPGAPVPLETEFEKIKTLRKALKARPGLRLDITGSYAPEADLAVLRDQLLIRQIRYRRWEELRSQRTDTPPLAQTRVTPEDETRIIGLFVLERYPDGLPPLAPDGSITPPVPGFVQRTPNVPANNRTPTVRRPQRLYASRPPEKVKPSPVEPVGMVFPADDAAATTPDGAPVLTLANARRALAAGIPVSTDDLLKLANERAQRVRDALIEEGEVAAERLLLTPPAPEGKGARVFLQLR